MAKTSIGGSLVRHIRGSLVSGSLLLLPVALTYLIVRFVFDLADGVLRPGIEWIVRQFGVDMSLPGPGIVAAVIVVYLIGALVSFRLGRTAVDWARTSLLRIPFIGTVYSANRQLIESFSGTSVTGFKRVVLVQFPRTGTWSLGFLTGITDTDGVEKLIMTYVPTAPLPNSGFVVFMPAQDVLDTNLTVPDAMQLIFSGGIVSPATIKTKTIDVAEVEEQIAQMDLPAEGITRAVKNSVTNAATKAAALSVRGLRRSSGEAVRAAGAAGHGSVSVVRDAMIGTVHAMDSLGGQSVEQVRDATKGVVLGVRDATGLTARMLHDAVSGAIVAGRGRRIQEASTRGATEGTIEIAASLGTSMGQAVTEISRATIDALKNSDEELLEGAKAVMKGVISGVASTAGNVADAARQSAHELVAHAGTRGVTNLGPLTVVLVDGAAEAAEELSIDSEALTDAVAQGCLEAARGLEASSRDAIESAIADRLPGIQI